MARHEWTARMLERADAFVNRLVKERNRQGVSQQQLADRAQVAVGTLKALELRQTKVPNVFLAADLVRALSGDLSRWLK